MRIQIESALVTGIYEGKNKVDYYSFQFPDGGVFKMAVPKELKIEGLEWGNMVMLEGSVSSQVFNNNLSLKAIDLKIKVL